MSVSKHSTNRYFKMRINGKTILTATNMGFPKVELGTMTVKMGGSPNPHVEPVDATWTAIDVTKALIKDDSIWQDFLSRSPVSPSSGSNPDGSLFTADLIRTNAQGVEISGWRLFAACYVKFGESDGDAGNTEGSNEEFSLAYSYAEKLSFT